MNKERHDQLMIIHTWLRSWRYSRGMKVGRAKNGALREFDPAFFHCAYSLIRDLHL